jgi:hypothetical protein
MMRQLAVETSLSYSFSWKRSCAGFQIFQICSQNAFESETGTGFREAFEVYCTSFDALISLRLISPLSSSNRYSAP